MADFRRAGSFRQRARNAERTTRQLRGQRQQRAAVRTHDAIREFEEHLRSVQESVNANVDDLPMDAEAGHLRDHLRNRERLLAAQRDSGSDTSSNGNPMGASRHLGATLTRSQSEFHGGRSGTLGAHQLQQHAGGAHQPTLHATAGGGGPAGAAAAADVDARFCQRPPSPLALYDYGGISARPRSMLAQRSKAAGEPMRPAYRHASPGFYYPGPEFRTGPYGFSMLDPIHMPPKCWETSKTTPNRWAQDHADMRPPMTEGHEYRHRRSRAAGPAAPGCVASSAAHGGRAKLAFHTLDRRNEEAQLEQVKFENGVFEGRWRDPSLDANIAAAALAPAMPADCQFLAGVTEEAPRGHRLAAKMLFGIEAALGSSKGNLRSLFRPVNRGTVGALEPEEFLEGLVRIGVAVEGALTPEDVIEAFAAADPHFDGRVNFTALERAVASARDVQRRRAQEAQRQAQNHEKKMTSSYSEALPIDVVRVERDPKSLFDFEREFERFRKQQRDLLAHHGELMH